MLLMGGGKNRRMDEGRGRDYRERDRDYDRHHDRERIDYEPESRFRDSRGREHYDNGRYAPARSEYDGYSGVDYGYMGYHTPPYVPPVYEREERSRMPMNNRMRMGGREYYDDREPRMNRIGFSLDGEMNRLPDDERREYMGRSAHPMDREHMSAPMQLTRETAMEWTGDMVNADGTTGPHWSMEQVRQVMEQRGIDCDPLEFYAVLNAVYSDYCAVAKRHGVNKPEFYIDMAKAWIDDQDAAKGKAARYFHYIVKH